MVETVYAIELLHQGKYDSWEFSSEEKRNRFYEEVKKNFSGREIADKESVEDIEIVQLSATSVKTDEPGGDGQPVPYEWYEADAFEEMLAYINGNYTE